MLQDVSSPFAETAARLLWYENRRRERTSRVGVPTPDSGGQHSLAANGPVRFASIQGRLSLCRLRVRENGRNRLRVVVFAKHSNPTSHWRHHEHLTMREIGSRDLGPDDQPEAQERWPGPSQCVKESGGRQSVFAVSDQSRASAAVFSSLFVSLRDSRKVEGAPCRCTTVVVLCAR